MTKYIIKRVLAAIPVLIGITIIDYFIMSLAGSPLDMMVGPKISAESVAQKAAALGLDQPVYIQYFNWMKEVLHGNLGYSVRSQQAVTEIIGSHIGSTLLLMGLALLVGLIIAIPIGIYSAMHKYKKRDYFLTTLSFFGTSIPSFFLALVFVYFFTVKLGILPSGGMTTQGTDGGFLDVCRHLVMPVLVLAISVAGSNIRFMRGAMLEVLQQDYLVTAKAKGLSHGKVINKHAFRNALLPIVTLIGMQIPTLFGGAVIIEQMFSWPGLGLITMNAITQRDYPVIMGVCLLTAIIVLLANLITDILYAVVDPTIQYD